MLLTIDVGNTNTVLGVFRGEELVANWRLTTAREQTVDEYGVLTRNLFTLAGLGRGGVTRGVDRSGGARGGVTAARGDQRPGKSDWDEHRNAHAGGFVLRRG